MRAGPLVNPFAYIPPQCYTQTRDEDGRSVNPCYVCHRQSEPPNFAGDEQLQLRLDLPLRAAENRWSNLFEPAAGRVTPLAQEELLAYVRRSNYRDDAGELVLARKLEDLPAAWDGEGDAHWNGFRPDAYFQFDEAGFDLRPDGTRSGWRAFAYYPLPGTFFPSNGSAADVLIRLDPALREDEVNFAIVEALISRRDVPIPVTDERRYGVDLDQDGRLSQARRVRFHPQRMHYVGRAHALELAGKFPIAPGLFPLNTEFLHSLRYLDVVDGRVHMAARMKELRYAKKARWFSEADLRAHAQAERVEQRESATGARAVLWQFDRGVSNGQGWLLQAFIEDAGGELRPETYEESVFCAGCHAGVGATTDSMFAFARKLSSPAGGYFHWSQRDLNGLPEPRRADGTFEYAQYLRENRAGDEFRDNAEILQRFFEPGGGLRESRLAELRRDIASLLMPSPERALALDQAYRAVVVEQSFLRGRDARTAPSSHVAAQLQAGGATGVVGPVR